MTKTPDNFINKLKKLDNYFILREEDEYFILGTKTNVKEHVEIHSTFSTYTSNKDRTLFVFFILGLDDNISELNDFRKKKLPILILSKSMAVSKLVTLKKYLDDFVNNNL